jgi:site-specific DNA recombinase
MKRVAIYARFSSDLQESRSIGDQVTLCCEYAQRQGYSVVRVYDDAAASGASLHGRPGITRLLADAEAKVFEVLVAESMSRIGRDQEDRAYVRKRLRFFGVGIETPSEGVVTPLIDGVRAALDSEYLEDLKRHTRRGMTGRVRDGLSAGGLTYGYAPGGKKGERVIVEYEAAIVRRIFEEYAAGHSPRAIAEGLNTDGVKPPRGRDWQASAINGNSIRGSGILMNALYDGRLTWNRSSRPRSCCAPTR